MSYYKTCHYCGCHLDPGEVCDCQTNKAEQNEQVFQLEGWQKQAKDSK